MKSLFLRIFLSFWMAFALFLVGVHILVTLALRPRSSTWEALRTTVLNDAVSAYEQAGRAATAAIYEEMEAAQHVRVYLFDESGEELSHRAPPVWAIRGAGVDRPFLATGLFFRAPPVQRDSRASSDGRHRYTLVMGPPPGPRVFIGPRGLPVPALSSW